MAENGRCHASVETRSVAGAHPVADRLPGLVHELANLVQAVSGNLELLANGTLDETSSRYLANARAAAQYLTELTQGLQAEIPGALKSSD